MRSTVPEKALISVFLLVGVLYVFISSAHAIEQNITWQHDGENVTRFEVFGNTDSESMSTLLGVVDRLERRFTINLPDDCSPVFVLVRSCNDDNCSNPSNIKMFKIDCPLPAPPMLDGISPN